MGSGERWLLTGATGKLGAALLAHWRAVGVAADLLCIGDLQVPPDINWLGAIDLTDLDAVESMLARTRPTRIFHCAGVSRPAIAQINPAAAKLLHVDATARMANHVRSTGGWLLHCSTDFVFSGEERGARREEDETLPRNVYGLTKLAGEKALLAREAGLVARLSLLYDVTSPGVGRARAGWSMLVEQLRRDDPVVGITDEFRTPIRYAEAAARLTELAVRNRRGLVHIGGPEILSPFQLIGRVAREIGSRSFIRPIDRAMIAGGVDRPENVALDSTRLRFWLSDEARSPAPVAAAA